MSVRVVIDGATHTLGRKEFVGSGGEGDVYSKNGKAIKIYNNNAKLIPGGKIRELSVLEHERIIKPLEQVLDYPGHKPIGYVMKFVNGLPLCQLFTRAFRERNGITPNMVLGLARDLMQLVKHAHERDVLVVDLNEMNFLSDGKFQELYAIDVDSWQTKHYPATAIMDSVRDWHCGSTFTAGSDWFSYAVVSFQLLIGIHPYRGRHVACKGLTERMIANLSVFNKDVSVPASCFPLDSIPPRYRAWYEEVFEYTLREEPPFEISGMLFVPVKQQARPTTLNISCAFKADFPITWYDVCGGIEIIGGNTQVIVDRKQTYSVAYKLKGIVYGHGRLFGVFGGGNNVLEIRDLTAGKVLVSSEIHADGYMVYEGVLYYTDHEYLFRADIVGDVAKLVVLAVLLCDVLNNTRFYPGVMIQNMLGTYYATLFPKFNNVIQVRLPIEAGYRIVDAYYSKGVMMVVSEYKGKYDRSMYVVSSMGIIIAMRKVQDISLAGLNFVVLDNGVVIDVAESDEIEIFHKDDPNKVKRIQDSAVHNGMKLYTDGGGCYYLDGDCVMKISMV